MPIPLPSPPGRKPGLFFVTPLVLAAGCLVLPLPVSAAAAEPERPATIPLPSVKGLVGQLPCTVDTFLVSGRPAFLIRPKTAPPDRPIPWVWYAPVIGNASPNPGWLLQQWLPKGIGMAGIDVGESFGSPQGRAIFTAFWQKLCREYGMSPRPCLLPQSRGGLMLYNWAVENPSRVAAIAGIYTVCDLRSYPGVKRACGAYRLTPEELEARLAEHNPIDRLAQLAAAKVPILHIHGDVDKLVPLERNAGELARRYRDLGGPVRVIVVPGKGHQVCPEFFQCQEFADFVVAQLVGPKQDSASMNWPFWRGPDNSGSTGDGSYPTQWSSTTNVLWKVALPGKGSSTPIIWQRKIFLTCAIQGEDGALAFDGSGKPLWQKILGPERPGKHRNGSGSNPSPATDGHGLFAYFKSGTLAALELDGRLRWKINLQERFGKDSLWWDVGTSPVLTAQDVVVAVMHQGNSYLAAFDKTTGQLHWKVDRNYKTSLEGDHSYTTPLVFGNPPGESILVWGGEHLTAHAANDGKTLWSCGDFNPQAKSNWVTVASPVIAGDIAVVPYGRGERLHGIRLGGQGDVTTTHRVWNRDDTGSFVPTPAVYKGKLYLLRDRGEVECVDPTTGKTVWQNQLPKKSAKYYASPLVAGGNLYAAREDGVVFVAPVEGDFKVLAENDLGERLIASPVPIAGRLLLRGEKHLFCVAAPAQAAILTPRR